MLPLAVIALAIPVSLALLAVPAAAAGPTVTVTSPEQGIVVEGNVLFQGTAEDPDGDLSSVAISIEGFNPEIKVNLPGAKGNATWEKLWNSLGAPDGLRKVSIVAKDKAGQTSEPVNFTLLVDNFKEPQVDASRLFFDEAGDGGFTPWNDLEAVPTTRVGVEITFSEEMDGAAVEAALSFTGGTVTWELTPKESTKVFWLNISQLEVSTTYNLTVGTQATDMAGNPLRASHQISFHTVAEATPGTPEQAGFQLPFDPLWLWIGGAAGGGAIAGVVSWKKGWLSRLYNYIRQLPSLFRGEEG